MAAQPLICIRICELFYKPLFLHKINNIFIPIIKLTYIYKKYCLLHCITYMIADYPTFNVIYVLPTIPLPTTQLPRGKRMGGLLYPEICGSLCGNSQHSVSTDIKLRSTISIPGAIITHVKAM